MLPKIIASSPRYRNGNFPFVTDLLYVSDLSLAHSRTAPLVTGLSFSIAPGESVGLVGPSGAGKSLTASALLGLLPARSLVTGGHAAYMDKTGLTVDLLQISQRKLAKLRGRELGFISQDPLAAFNPVLSCGDQLRETIDLLRSDVADSEALLRQLLESVGLGEVAERTIASLPYQLSGGQLQRVLIANALVGRPRLLIADEPTTALDVIVENDILQLLDNLRRDTGMSLLYITHDERVLHRVTDRAIDLTGKPVSKPGRPSVLRVTHKESEAHPTPPALSVRGLTIHHPGAELPAVDKCSFDVGVGEYVALIGPSGCGKSTLAAWLSGLLPAVTGQAIGKLGKVTATATGEQVRDTLGIQLIFQHAGASLTPGMRVGKLLREVCRIHGGVHTVAGLLEAVGLTAEDHADRRPDQLSGGQQQRVAIARAMAARPRVLICDEVLSSLDTARKAGIQELLIRLTKEQGIALLFVTHDLREVVTYADRVLVMYGGRIVEAGETGALLRQPRLAITRQLVTAAGLMP